MSSSKFGLLQPTTVLKMISILKKCLLYFSTASNTTVSTALLQFTNASSYLISRVIADDDVPRGHQCQLDRPDWRRA
jgi:hypothetical protein